ncbi:hypothetical protein [Methylophilus sp. 5]|uniref:hypothetical protein n=1 Tax=Methylophilus sp. 5 TaxID=1112274 RepID=UPI000491370A|nr:hypothetical protein [Methylophilus sp. 5]
MRTTLYPGNTHAHRAQTPWLARDEKRSVKSPSIERGSVDIGKVNVILIGLIVLILVGLLSKEDTNAGFSSQAMRIQTQVVSDAGPDESEEAPASVAQVDANTAPAQVAPAKPGAKPELKPGNKKSKKMEVAEPEPAYSPVVEMHASQALPVVEPVQQKETSRKMLVFNIWSVSELRLRSAYTTLMNDSSIPALQLEARKKDYLNFVAKRTRKCGELDNKFASNINSVEKLSFSKGEVETLECHASENNIELDKINALNTREL